MRIKDLPRATRRCGPVGAAKLWTARRKLRRLLPRLARLDLKGFEFPGWFRRVSSDRYVIVEVLLRDQYACLTDHANVETILDVGANIGTASLYLLNRYPTARLVALEPDPDSFEMLEMNLRPYGRRATAIRAALWPRAEPLFVDRGHFRDGAEWSFQVTDEPLPSAPRVPGVPFATVLDDAAIDFADIVKIDVEGAERLLFQDALGGALDRIGLLAVELHDHECRQRFFDMIAGRPGELSRVGEVTMWNQRTGVAR